MTDLAPKPPALSWGSSERIAILVFLGAVSRGLTAAGYHGHHVVVALDLRLLSLLLGSVTGHISLWMRGVVSASVTKRTPEWSAIASQHLVVPTMPVGDLLPDAKR